MSTRRCWRGFTDCPLCCYIAHGRACRVFAGASIVERRNLDDLTVIVDIMNYQGPWLAPPNICLQILIKDDNVSCA